MKDEDGIEKVLVILYVHPGSETPYFYKYKGEMVAFTRVGNSSVKADAVTIRRLSLKGSNKSWDSLVSEYSMKDFSFSRLKSLYHARTGKSFEDDMFQSLEICDSDGRIINAGLLWADIFHRLQLMECSGSGIKEIMNDYKASANITEDRLPTFFSDESDFNVTFWNLNYGVTLGSNEESNGESSGEK